MYCQGNDKNMRKLFPGICLIFVFSCRVQEPRTLKSPKQASFSGDSTLISLYEEYLDCSDSAKGSVVIDGTNKTITAGFTDEAYTSISMGAITVNGINIPESPAAESFGHRYRGNDVAALFSAPINVLVEGGYYPGFSTVLNPTPLIDLSTPSGTVVFKSVGKIINWNAASNSLGVLIDIGFSPHSPDNKPGVAGYAACEKYRYCS